MWLVALGMCSALQFVMRINIFLTMFLLGVANTLIRAGQRLVLGFMTMIGFVAYVLVAVYIGQDSGSMLGTGVMTDPSMGSIFVHGLLGGLLTFGGAYTAIPFIQQDAVTNGHWLTGAQFLDGLAISSILPAPLVIFVTFVGYLAGSLGGALLITLGMFLPAFSFTLIGHHLFERLVNNIRIAAFLEGITASVVGMVAITAFQIIKAVIIDPPSVVLFFLTLISLYAFNHRFASVLIVLSAAIAGQVLFV